MRAAEWGWQIDRDELASWILHDDEHLLVVNKPGLVVCHPSKHGPWSSLVGACREHLGVDRLHMPSRLDRETSGVVVLAKDHGTASKLQTAIQRRAVTKTYTAILTGQLGTSVTVDQPIGRAHDDLVRLRQTVTPDGAPSVTDFEPVEVRDNWTLARVRPHTGRLHQIRVHAAWLGHPVLADKIYGPDERLFLEFIEHGFTSGLAQRLPLARQALHASRIEFHLGASGSLAFEAPLAADMADYIASH